jgi:octaprenyl-diphosphate synthase
MTLPLIYTLKTVSPETRRKLIYIIKNKSKDKSSVQLVIDEVIKAGGISYAEGVMNSYKKAALDALESFPASEAREALSELVTFTTERKK